MRRSRWPALLALLVLLLAVAWWVDRETGPGPVRAATAPRRPRTVHRPVAPAASGPTEPLEEPPGSPPADLEAPGESDGILRIDVVRSDGTPEPDAIVSFGRCGAWTVLEDAPDHSVVRVEPGPCEVTAWRQDGWLRSPTQRVHVEVRAGQRDHVTLRLPATRTGGIGIQMRETDEGMEVLRVIPGSPAERAGLAPGDVIVEVDGEQAADLSAEEFQSVMTGPEGSTVRFVVAHVSDTGIVEDVLELGRAFLGRS